MTRALIFIPFSAIMLAGCSRTSLDLLCEDHFGQRAVPQCERAVVDPPEMVMPEQAALEVLSAGCDIVALLATEPNPVLYVSVDGGMTFGPARSLPPNALLQNLGWPRDMPLAMAENGTLYVLSRGAEGLQLNRSDDFAKTWDAPIDITKTKFSCDESLLMRGEEVNAIWSECAQWPPREAHLARSRDGGRSFEPTVSVRTGERELTGGPVFCAAGARGMVGGRLECTGTDCVGDDRTGTALGMVAISEGGQFSNQELFRLDNGDHAPVAGCSADGRALVTWSAKPYTGSIRDMVVAAVLPCGIVTETARFIGVRNDFLDPWSPTPVLGRNGALLFWGALFEMGSGIASVDAAGALISVTLDPDFNADGAHDIPLSACAFPEGGYALLTAGSDYLDGPMQAIAAFLTDDGTPAEVRVLGPLDDRPYGGWVRCDGRGRAHFFWKGDGHARYAAFRAAH